MTNQTLQLGFIGGAIESAVGTTHKIASQMDQRWKLSAGCFSRHPESNLKTARDWGISADRTYSTYHDLLENEKKQLDAVVILTPTPSHAEIVTSALEKGYPVICEKALACSSEEAKKIKQGIDTHGGFLAVTYNYTGYPMVRELQTLIRSGRLGQIQQIHIEMQQEGFLRLDADNNRPLPQAWRLEDKQIPTLSLDLGVHVHHMIDFLTGEKPLELVSVSNNFGFFKGICDNIMTIARYSGNLDCQIWYGKTALGHTNGLKVRVYGEEGSAEWYQMEPERLTLHDNKGRITNLERASVDLRLANESRYNRFKAGHPAGFIEAFANLYYDIADELLAHKHSNCSSSPWVSGIETAMEGLVMLETMKHSSEEHRWLSIPD